MAKKSDGSEGTLIQLERTQLSLSQKADIIDGDGTLEFGEPLYLDNEKYMVIGDKEGTAPSELKVFKAFPRDLADSVVFFEGTASNQRVELVDESKNKLFTLKPYFALEKENTVGGVVRPVIPHSSGSEVVELKIPSFSSTNSSWHSVSFDSDGKMVIGSITTNPNEFPKAYEMSIPHMTENVIPIVTPFITSSQISSTDYSKIRASYSALSFTESRNGEVIFVVDKVNPSADFYVCVYGG